MNLSPRVRAPLVLAAGADETSEFVRQTRLLWDAWPANRPAGAREPLLNATAAIEAVVLASPVICSDETSVRVKGKNWWEWVFVTTIAVLHVIKPSRGKAVVTALFGEIRPEVWVSDMLGSQRGHGVE